MARCEECGFDWEAGPTALVEVLRSFGPAYEACLTRLLAGEDETILRVRPAPDVWSALEYTAHMRDVVAFYLDRIERVLREDRPRLTAVGFDRLAEERRYLDDDPREVLDALAEGSAEAAQLLSSLAPEQWRRAGVGSEGGERTVLVLARRLVHDGHHHLLDVGRVLRHVRQRGREARS
jgi:hypothetical protein